MFIYDYYTIYYEACVVIVLWQPVSRLAKCHTKRCLELQNNTAGHTTFFGVADMLAGLVIVAMHMPICLFFNISSQPSFYDFTVLKHCFIVSWNTCISLPTIDNCPGIELLLVHCHPFF